MKPSIYIEQFRQRSPYVQQMLVKKYGVLLFAKTGDGVTAWLYQIEHFYVEVIFDEQAMKLLCIYCFEDVAGLCHYLEQVDISEILSLIL